MICTSLISYKRRKWVVAEPAADEIGSLSRVLSCSPVIAQMLFNRGITTPEQAAAFLHPEFKNLCSPKLLPNMDKAAERIAQAVREKQKIVLYGDYDVDGITGTTMLWHTLRAAGADVSTYIPHRVDEGYGLNTAAITQLVEGGAKLIVTIDCGISGIEPIAAAQAAGVDVIVSDHHEIPAILPNAHAIVHPRLEGSAYPNPDLCGAGVAFKLAWCICQKLSNAEKVTAPYRALLVEFAALAALGTIADVVPLVGENRILVKHGLTQLARTGSAGLVALMDAAGYGDGRKLDTIAVGFALAPRLNAAGRMGHASEAVELLTTATPERAAEIAKFLEAQNRQRQATERQILIQAREQIAAHMAASSVLPHVIVVEHASFHAGVVGIVASRIVDQFHRPTFVLAAGEAQSHGSARSIPGFELHLAIEHCRDLLVSGGGHAMAGGIKLTRENVAGFRTRVNAYAAGVLTADQLVPVTNADGELTLDMCNMNTMRQLEDFEPFGRGNPHPRFVVRKVRISAPPRRVGSTGAHIQLQISAGTRTTRCIAFRMGDLEPQLPVGTEVDLVVEPRIDHYYENNPRVDLQVIDIARCDQTPFERVAEA